jgi:hypothetical protein
MNIHDAQEIMKQAHEDKRVKTQEDNTEDDKEIKLN